MRHVFIIAVGLTPCLVAPSAEASQIGLPTVHFVQTWTPVPSAHFTQPAAMWPYKRATARAADLSNEKLTTVLDDAFASARSETERRDIALSETMAPWDQKTRTAFQHLRDAEEAYAGADDVRHARFVATFERATDGTGRSAAIDGSAAPDLDKAYAVALAATPEGARATFEAKQKAWRAYRAAFAAFADLHTPGSADGVTSEVDRQRASDLATVDHAAEPK